jgi:hypothetical protein
MSHGGGVVCATLVLSSLVLASAVPPARTQQPATRTETVTPPWQGSLHGVAAKKAAALEQQLGQLRQAGKLAQALQVAESLAALRQEAQGDRHAR